MIKLFKKSIIILFTLSLVTSSCSLRKNNIKENKDLAQPEIINKSRISNENEVSSRGRVLCFERAQKEKNAFLSEIAYENCLLTIDKNLEEYDKKQADLYFLDKKEGNKITKPKNKIKQVKKKKKKKKKKNSKVVNIKKKENNCKEGTIAGGAIGAGIGLATAKGKDKFWAVPAGGVAGALIGCQIDGG